MLAQDVVEQLLNARLCSSSRGPLAIATTSLTHRSILSISPPNRFIGMRIIRGRLPVPSAIIPYPSRPARLGAIGGTSLVHVSFPLPALSKHCRTKQKGKGAGVAGAKSRLMTSCPPSIAGPCRV
jgi:hypothetical protein